MAYEYEKNEWESYNENYPLDKQPDSLITKTKLDRMEAGIERSSMSIDTGNIGFSNDENPSVSVTVDEIEHTRKINILFPKQKEVESGASIDDSTFNKNTTWSSQKINTLVNEINQKIDDLSYEPITIQSFTNNVGTVEKGNTVNSITFNWATNKVPQELTLNGIPLDVVLHSTTITDIITSNTSYILRAVDEKQATSTKTSTISFVNGVYYGKAELIELKDMTSTFIRSLEKRLSSSAKFTFTVNAGQDEHIYFVCPLAYSQPSFYVGGFEGGFKLLGEFNFTNQYNYSERYNIYVSEQPNLGVTTVECK